MSERNPSFSRILGHVQKPSAFARQPCDHDHLWLHPLQSPRANLRRDLGANAMVGLAADGGRVVLADRLHGLENLWRK
jgi:hypothetical protein